MDEVGSKMFRSHCIKLSRIPKTNKFQISYTWDYCVNYNYDNLTFDYDLSNTGISEPKSYLLRYANWWFMSKCPTYL